MVERTTFVYVVGQGGMITQPSEGTQGSNVGAKVLLSEGGNTSTVPRLATTRCGAAPAVSGRCMSTTNIIAAISAAGKFYMRLASSLLSGMLPQPMP
jgi:hypothetical protein